MPRVPTAAAEYQPFSTAQPSGERAPSINVQADPGAFGVNIGQSLVRLGGQLNESGQELFNRASALQELQNETQARDTARKSNDEQAMASEKFLSTENATSEAGLKAHMDNLEAIRQKYRGDLTNNSAQRHFDSYTFHNTDLNVRSAIRHAATETKRYHKNSVEAEAANSVADLFKDPSPERWDNFTRNIDELAKTKAGLDNLAEDDPLMEKWKHDHILKGASNYFKGLSNSDPIKAYDMLTKAIEAGQMEGDVAIVTMNYVQDRYASSIARNKEKVFNADFYDTSAAAKRSDKTLDERKKEALKWLEEQNYPTKLREEIQDKLMRNIETGWNQNHKSVVEIEEKDWNTVSNGLRGIDGQGNPGSIPTTEEELRAKGGSVGLALDAMRERRDPKYGSVFSALMRNSKKDTAPTREGDMMNRGLIGLATTNPPEFVQVDLWDKKYDILTRRQRDHLFNLQDKLLKNPTEDPNVSRAIKIMKTNGIWPTRGNVSISETNDPTAFRWLTGSLYLEIKAMTAKELEKPKDEQILQLGRALTEKQDVEGFGWFGLATKPDFYEKLNKNIEENGIPTERADKLRQMYPNDSDEDLIKRYIVHMIKIQYDKQFGKRTPSGPIKPQR